MLLLTVLTLTAPAGAGTETARDILQTIRARQVLLQDPQLAPLNLGVRVRDRVATLWGPVSSIDLSLKAERAMRSLFELTDVHNELEVHNTAEPAGDLLPAALSPGFLPEQLPPALPRLPPGAPAAVNAAAAPRKPSPAAQPVARKTTEAPAIALPGIEPLPARMPRAPEQASAAPKELAHEIESLLKSKESYRSVSFVVREGRVYLRGPSRESDVLHELARTIAQLSGVEGVILVGGAGR